MRSLAQAIPIPGTAIEMLAQIASPSVDDCGAMLDGRHFASVGTGDLKTSPLHPDKLHPQMSDRKDYDMPC